MASGDGSDRGSSSGCENKGSRARQGVAQLGLGRAGGGSGYGCGKGDSGLR